MGGDLRKLCRKWESEQVMGRREGSQCQVLSGPVITMGNWSGASLSPTQARRRGHLVIRFFLSWERATSGGINFQAQQPVLHLGRVEHGGYLRAMLPVQKW